MESEYRFRVAMEVVNEGLWEVQLNTGEAYYSPTYFRMLGYDEHEITQTLDTFISLVHPEDRSGVLENRDACVRNNEPFHHIFRMKTKHAGWAWISAKGQVTEYDSEGNPLRYIGTHTDITEQRLLEDQLRDNEKRYRHLFQNTLTSIWEEDFSDLWQEILRLTAEGITDLKGYLDANPSAVQDLARMITIVDVNEVTLRWYEATSKEEIRGNLEKVTTPGTFDILKQEIIAIAEGRHSVEGETRARTLTGEEFDVSIRIALPAPDEKPKRMIVAINDITALKKALLQKGILMRELNHRVKNSLLLVSTFISMKQRELGDTADLSDVQNRVNAVMLMHEQMSKSEDLGNVDLHTYLSRITQTVLSFSDRNCTADVDIDVDVLPSGIAVPVGLIVNEIMTNALKHGFMAGQNGVCRVQFAADEAEGWYTLMVSNDGAPLPEDIDVSHPETMGLQLITALVQQLDGNIEIERVPHPVFTIRFPLGNPVSR